jgi:hypothetical protein
MLRQERELRKDCSVVTGTPTKAAGKGLWLEGK